MGNFVLQIGPCSSLFLRISPWGNPFPLLLCSLIPGALIFFSLPPAAALSNSGFSSSPPCCSPLSPSSAARQEPVVRCGRRMRWASARGGAAPARVDPSGPGGAAGARRQRPRRAGPGRLGSGGRARGSGLAGQQRGFGRGA
jgi:hypothetical protein